MAYEESTNNNRLQELGGSDYKIVDGQPNIKGWTVKDNSGKKLGEVDELIFDAESRKVRYIVLDLDDNELDLDDREVLIPIGLAELHEDDDDVILKNITAEQLGTLPEYHDNSLDSDMENNIRNVFGGASLASMSAGTDNAFYDHDHFNEDNLYQRRRGISDSFENAMPTTENTLPVIEEELSLDKREVETGGVRIDSKIVEESVEEDITLRSERATLEHNPVNRPATEADFENVEDLTLELKNKIEVPVIQKDTRVVEEISLNKTIEEKEETIHDTVRKTEVDIERLDDDTNNDDRTHQSNP